MIRPMLIMQRQYIDNIGITDLLPQFDTARSNWPCRWDAQYMNTSKKYLNVVNR